MYYNSCLLCILKKTISTSDGFVLSAWLGRTTFPRIHFYVYFWLGWTTRDVTVENLEGKSEAAAILQLTCIVSDLLIHLIGIKQWPHLKLPHHPLDLPSASLTPWPGNCVQLCNSGYWRTPIPLMSETLRTNIGFKKSS